jgi:hypothetical protein
MNEDSKQLWIVALALVAIVVALTVMRIMGQRQSNEAFADCLSKGGGPAECMAAVKETR